LTETKGFYTSAATATPAYQLRRCTSREQVPLFTRPSSSSSSVAAAAAAAPRLKQVDSWAFSSQCFYGRKGHFALGKGTNSKPDMIYPISTISAPPPLPSTSTATAAAAA